MFTEEANMVSFRREEPNFFGLMINHAIFVSGFVFLFPSFIRNQNTRLKSIIFGVVLALIMFVPTGIVVRSIWTVDFNLIFILNAIAHRTIGGLLGLILRTIYNYKTTE